MTAPAETDSAIQDANTAVEGLMKQRQRQADELFEHLSWQARAIMRASLEWREIE